MRVSPEAGIPTAAWILPNVPAGAGHGRYWFRALDGPGGTEGTVGAAIVDDERTTGASVGGVPGELGTVARYVHRDHLGSTRAVTDEIGAVRGTWKFYPFGAEAHATGEPGPRMMFTGHERDAVAGLDYMLARYYSPGLSRFLSADPIAFKGTRLFDPQRLSLYTYALNNPLKYLDESGKEASVFVVGPGEGAKKQYGHSAIFVSTDKYSGGISYGGRYGFEGGKDAFIASYTKDGRSVTEFTLNTTPEQDAKLASFVQSNPDGAVDHTAVGADSMVTENCTTAVGNALEAAGVVPEGESTPGSGALLDMPSSLEEDLDEGGDNEDMTKEKVVHEPVDKEEKK